MAADPDPTAEEFSGAGAVIDAALYKDLRKVAHRERLRAGRPATMQTTAVLHEAYVRLAGNRHWDGPEHFLSVAATTMRYVLVDAARARLSAKRGGGERPISIDDVDVASDGEDRQIVRLGDALQLLGALDPPLAKLVDCRFFVGLTEEETARVLGVSDRTIRRRWLQARAWIHQELED